MVRRALWLALLVVGCGGKDSEDDANDSDVTTAECAPLCEDVAAGQLDPGCMVGLMPTDRPECDAWLAASTDADACRACLEVIDQERDVDAQTDCAEAFFWCPAR